MERKLGAIATRVLLENERVRVWEMRMPPGETGPVHRHELDHLLIQLAGDRMAVVPEPDSAGPYREYLEADVAPGQVFYVQRGGVEAARNVGQREYHEILIELKD
jgi:predicted metal-dependent enzyme (double-stranded beta helix superfamily)